MKKRKERLQNLAVVLALIFAIGFSPVINANAKAAPQLNYKKITIVQGKKKQLKVRDLKKGQKIKWSSTKKSIAMVSKKGVVKAKKKGTAYIVAKVGKKKYRCKVTVKKKSAKKTTSKKLPACVKKQLPAYELAFLPEKNYAAGTSLDFLTTVIDAYAKDFSSTSDSVRTKYWRWYSSDKSVISFNSKGIATFKKKGGANVYCKYMIKSGTWVKSRTVSIKIIDGGNIKFSYSLSLEDSPIKQEESSVWDFRHENPVKPNPNSPKFNTITLKIQNNSSKAVRVDTIAISTSTTPDTVYFTTANNKSVNISAHTNKVIKCYATYSYGAYGQEMCYNYVIDKKVFDGVFVNYKYNGVRLQSELKKNSSNWKTFKSNYLTRKEWAEDEPYR